MSQISSFKASFLCSVAALFLLPFVGRGARADIVTPNDQAAVEGNVAGNFNTNANGQQVLLDISSSQFGTLSSGDVLSGLAFRPDTNLFPGSAFGPVTLHNVTITLATTLISPNSVGQSLTFSDYLTTNAQTVFSGDVILSSNFTGPAIGPKDFDILFPFTSNYAYNPANGNLVVDILISSADGLPVAIDAVAGPSSMSELFANAISTDGLINSNVDIVKFTTASNIGTQVPEPGSMAMLGSMLTMLGGIGYVIRRRRQYDQ